MGGNGVNILSSTVRHTQSPRCSCRYSCIECDLRCVHFGAYRRKRFNAISDTVHARANDSIQRENTNNMVHSNRSHTRVAAVRNREIIVLSLKDFQCSSFGYGRCTLIVVVIAFESRIYQPTQQRTLNERNGANNTQNKEEKNCGKYLPWNSLRAALTDVTMFATCPSTVANSINPNSNCAMTNTYSALDRGRGKSPMVVSANVHQ